MPKKPAPANVLIVEKTVELEDEKGKPRERFNNPIDAIEHAVNLVLNGDCRSVKVKATITVEAVE
jgi:hypothetical protein